MDVRGNDKRQGGGGHSEISTKFRQFLQLIVISNKQTKQKKTLSVTKAGKPAWQNTLFGPFLQKMHSLLFLTFVIVT